MPYRFTRFSTMLTIALAVAVPLLPFVASTQGASAARSSKPKEIVVVGSKIKDVVKETSIDLNLNWETDVDGNVSVAGHFWLTDSSGNRHGGPIKNGGLRSDGELVQSGFLELSFDIVGPHAGGAQVREHVALTYQKIEFSESPLITGHGRKTSLSVVGDFDYSALIADSDGNVMVEERGTAHGHLDYLKIVRDPAT